MDVTRYDVHIYICAGAKMLAQEDYDPLRDNPRA